MKILGKDRDPLEFSIAVAGLALAISSPLAEDAKVPVLIVAGALFGALGLLMLRRGLRRFRFVPGVSPVMAELERLARASRQSVWTARSHLGSADGEKKYFELLAARVKTGEVADVKRVISLADTAGTRAHLTWLIDNLSDQEAVKVRVRPADSNVFDFAVFDGKAGALGFPQSEKDGFLGGVFTEHPEAVRGLEAAFNAVWAESKPLFGGRPSITDEEKEELRKKAKILCRGQGGAQ